MGGGGVRIEVGTPRESGGEGGGEGAGDGSPSIVVRIDPQLFGL